MAEISNQKNDVLLAGSFPPPCGGVASINEIIYRGFNDKPYTIIPLDSSSFKRKKRIKSSTELTNLLFQCIQVMQFLYLTIKHNCRIVHISVSSYHGFYKSAMFIIMATLLRKKKVLHLHGGYFNVFYQKRHHIVKQFIKIILQQGDVIIALSIHWKNILVNDFKITPKKVMVLNNCYHYEFNDFIFKRKKKTDAQGNHRLNLLFIGDLNKNKGIFDLITICEELLQYRNHFMLRIVGQDKKGGTQNRLQEIINLRNMSKYIKLMGEVRGKEKLRIFQESDIFILPSYIENFPVTVVEAMRAGLPIVTTPVGSIPEIINDSINGYLIEPGKIRGFVDRIVMLSMDLSLMQGIAQRNIKKAIKKYDPVFYSRRLKEIYDFVLDRRN